ncbi:hypothetical protein DPMN_150239 [Dreissena polymorpha]|uniref:Uncharacterized protein n=1 Tax=Dreissena polymorpha TaxID=45954 RepID=A0A9D4J361_DREPO|nr:hypothetical protein DPMN_150239 [Dreissena polymorpha]
MGTIRKPRTGCTSGYKELLEPKHSKITGVKKFMVDKLKRLKSRRQYKNPFKNVKFADEKLVNVIYTIKVHDNILVYQTKSNQTTQNKENWCYSPHVDVTSDIKTSGSGSETPALCVMTPVRLGRYGDRDIRTERRRTSDDGEMKRQRANSRSARL